MKKTIVTSFFSSAAAGFRSLPVSELFPVELFRLVGAAFLFLLIAAHFAFAADATPTGQSWIDAVISYGTPLVEALLAAAVTWIISQVIRLLGITDQATRLKVEGQLRDALHFAAENGLKYAFAKLGVPPSLAASASVIADAITYVKDKNPDTVAALGVDDEALKHIILSKLPALATASWPPLLSVGVTGGDAAAPLPTASAPATADPVT